MRALLKLLLPAVATFAVVALALSLHAPWPEEYGYAAKLDYFEQHKDEYDVVFIGSSRIFRGVDPRIVDAELASAGIPLRSFNLGIGGMGAFETDYLLRRVVEMKPARLKWVIFEGLAWDPGFRLTQNTYAARTVFWHAPAETRNALVATLHHDATWLEKADLFVTHVQLLLWRFANYGSGSSFAAKLAGVRRDEFGRALTPEQLADGRGYQSLEILSDKDDALLRAEMLADLKRIEGKIAEMSAERLKRPDLSGFDTEALRAQFRAVESIGAKLAYVLPPAVEARSELLGLHERGDIPLLFDFNQPDAYPDLFESSRRYDKDHLSRKGAEEFSHLLGAAFAERLKNEARR